MILTDFGLLFSNLYNSLNFSKKQLLSRCSGIEGF
jgi:hypothetical protein